MRLPTVLFLCKWLPTVTVDRENRTLCPSQESVEKGSLNRRRNHFTPLLWCHCQMNTHQRLQKLLGDTAEESAETNKILLDTGNGKQPNRQFFWTNGLTKSFIFTQFDYRARILYFITCKGKELLEGAFFLLIMVYKQISSWRILVRMPCSLCCSTMMPKFKNFALFTRSKI